MHPGQADELESMRQQMLLFARDLNEVIARERRRRQEAEDALRFLNDSYFQMVKTLAKVVEDKDPSTRDHLDRTYQYAVELTRKVAPDLVKDPTVGYGFLLHDIGKIGIPDSILKKPGRLEDDERRIMQMHPLIGVQMVAPMKLMLGEGVNIIRSHHERWDGAGYPEKLAGEDIPLTARIFSVADTFDAMTSERHYKPGLPIDAALEEIDRCAGTHFDPEIAKAFVELIIDRKLHEAIGSDRLSMRS